MLRAFFVIIISADLAGIAFGKYEGIATTPLIILFWLLFIISVPLAEKLAKDHGSAMFIAPIIGGTIIRLSLGLVYVFSIFHLTSLDKTAFFLILMAKYILMLIYEISFTLRYMNIKLEFGKVWRNI